MKYVLSMVLFIVAMVAMTFLIGWAALFALVVAKNTLLTNIPNPMFLADCYTAKTEYAREFACDLAWRKR